MTQTYQGGFIEDGFILVTCGVFMLVVSRGFSFRVKYSILIVEPKEQSHLWCLLNHVFTLNLSDVNYLFTMLFHVLTYC